MWVSWQVGGSGLTWVPFPFPWFDFVGIGGRHSLLILAFSKGVGILVLVVVAAIDVFFPCSSAAVGAFDLIASGPGKCSQGPSHLGRGQVVPISR